MPLAITGELGRFEEFFSDFVYPVWPLWLAGAIVVAAALGWFAFRRGWLEAAWRHKLISGPIALVAAVAVIFAGYYTISPLFERETVCEASPIADAGAGSEECEDVAVAATNPPATGPAATVAPASEPQVVLQGEFQGADDFHFGEGKALIIETEPGKYVLRFEEFSVRNGPDLFVYLSPSPDGYDDAAINLGELKGTDGAFNYDIPEGTDVSQFKSAIVWCQQFSVLFATAAFS